MQAKWNDFEGLLSLRHQTASGFVVVVVVDFNH